MEYRAIHKYAKTSTQKAKQIADLVRGRTVSEALGILQFAQRRAADIFRKVIESALANATYEAQRARADLDPDTLIVKKICADKGPSLKRWRARARGRAAPILKRTSHLTVVLSTPQEEPASGPGEKEPAQEKKQGEEAGSSKDNKE